MNHKNPDIYGPRHSYEVISAPSGDEALERARVNIESDEAATLIASFRDDETGNSLLHVIRVTDSEE